MNTNRFRHWLGGRTDVVIPLLVMAVAASLTPFLGAARLIDLSLWIIYALLALSLFWTWGQGGMLSLGQTAFFGVGGYAYAVIAINLVGTTGETITAAVSGVAIVTALAALVGYFVIYGRISDMYLAITTLVITLILYTVFGSMGDPRYAIGSVNLGGYQGLSGVPPITFAVPGLFNLALTERTMYVLVVLVFAASYIGVKMLMRSPFGRTLAAVRENELRCELLGYDVRSIKLRAFILGGAIAGLAGVLFAAWGRFMNPLVFGLGPAAAVIIWLLVGGRRIIWGGLLGVMLVQGLLKGLGTVTQNTPIFLGSIMILTVMLFPAGLAGFIEARWKSFKRWAGVVVAGTQPAKLFPPPAPVPPLSGDIDDSSYAPERHRGMIAPVVEARDLAVSFGGVRALTGVTLSFEPGLCCVIGPNGAGKSTLFNLLVGRFRPAKGGIIVYDGNDITRLKVHQRNRLGIGIKTQAPSLFGGLSVEENVWVAAYRYLRNTHQATVKARKMLREVGLPPDRFAELAANLSHGEQQLLELAMVLASEAKFILLDEPSAGLMVGEKAHMAQLVSQLASSATVVVVEHDMEFVRKLGVPVIVLHQGQVFAQGSLEEVREDQRVIDIYLGRRGHAGA